MRKLLSGFLLLGVVASSNADACSFVKGATADAKVFHNGAKIYQNGVVGCYNQQTGGNASCTTALQHVGENTAAQAIINSLRGRGGCGSVGVQIAVRLGTRDRVDCGNKNYDTGGTWIAAVAASCQSGFSLVSGRCIQVQAAVGSCPQGYWLESHKQPFKCVKQACAAGSMPGVAAWQAIGGAANGGQYLSDDKGGSRFFINASLACTGLAGFNLEGDKCVKTAPVIAAVAAYCKR